MSFSTILEAHGKTATGMEVPESIVGQLGGGNRPAVTVTITGYTYRSSIAVMAAHYLLPVSADVRARAGIKAGDKLNVDVELDLKPRSVVVPRDLQKRPGQSPGAAQRFEKLSYSNKQRLVLPLYQAKTAETRQRRIDKIMADLSAASGQ